MIQTTYLSTKKYPDMADVDFSKTSLYGILETRFGTLIVNAKKVFEPVLLTKKEATLLNTKAGTPCAINGSHRL